MNQTKQNEPPSLPSTYVRRTRDKNPAPAARAISKSGPEHTPGFRQLCIVARGALQANATADWTTVAEVVKVAAARARLPYDGTSVGAAMTLVKASTRYTGPVAVAPVRVDRRLNTAEVFAVPRAPRPAAAPAVVFTSLGSIVDELKKRGFHA